jgi:DNA-binding transcriptional MerR regulator
MKFYAADIEKICGVKRPRLQTWMERGWIIPSKQKASGHGIKNIFSRNDLFMIKFFKVAVENGLPRKTVAELTRKLKIFLSDLDTSEPISLQGLSMYIIVFRKAGKIIAEYLMPFPMLKPPVKDWDYADDFIGINVSHIIDEVISKISEIKG